MHRSLENKTHAECGASREHEEEKTRNTLQNKTQNKIIISAQLVFKNQNRKHEHRMPTRFRKTRHNRGSTFCGYGRVGKHQKHPSGRGNAGGGHQHRINWDKYHPGYFGKLGMRHYHKKANPNWKPTLNLSQLAKFIPNAASVKKGGDLPVVDLLSKGYAKLLGNGIVPAACIVKARYVSKLAEKKLKAVGGAVELQA